LLILKVTLPQTPTYQERTTLQIHAPVATSAHPGRHGGSHNPRLPGQAGNGVLEGGSPGGFFTVLVSGLAETFCLRAASGALENRQPLPAGGTQMSAAGSDHDKEVTATGH